MPNFGPYKKEREEKIAAAKEKDDLLDENYHPKRLRPANQPSAPVLPIREIIAAAIDRIGTYNDLDNKQQVVAMIDEVNKCSNNISVRSKCKAQTSVLYRRPQLNES